MFAYLRHRDEAREARWRAGQAEPQAAVRHRGDGAVLRLLYLPIVAVVLFSFNDKKSLTSSTAGRCGGTTRSSTTPR